MSKSLWRLRPHDIRANRHFVHSRPTRSGSNQDRMRGLTFPFAVGATERVEVTAVSPILQTQDAVVGEVISGTTIERMQG
jgi:hypothetical protein